MKKQICAIAFICCMLLLICSCNSKEHTRSVFVMDSVANMRVFSESDKSVDEICETLYTLDDCFSAYDGEILRLNENSGGEMSYHVGEVLVKSLGLSEKTDGDFSPVLGNVIELWGIGSKNYIPTESEITSAMAGAVAGNIEVEGKTVLLKNGARLNFGAVAKGYATDVIRDILVDSNASGAVISLGGNVYVHGKRTDGNSWSVAIRDPKGNANDWLGALALTDKFVISSGDYERYFEHDGKRFHHIIDPKTGRPAESDLMACAVICDSGIMGDAYSTALYIMGREGALEFWRENEDFELVLIGRDGMVTVTEGISGVFTPNDTGRYSYETAKR